MRAVRIPLHLFLLALLVAATGWLWKNAWAVSGVAEPICLAPGPNPPGKTLSGAERVRWDSARGSLVLRENRGGPMPSHEIFLSGWPRGMAAHIRFAGETREMVSGAAEWQDGRVMVIWREADGRVIQPHYGLLGAKGTGRFELEYVAELDQPGQASIFLQHAGDGGEFEIDHLEITPVGLRRWVPWATGALLCATGIWWASLFRGIAGRAGPWRPLGAAVLGLVAVWTLVLPGPWEPLRPLGGPFVLQQCAPAASGEGIPMGGKPDSIAPAPMLAAPGSATLPVPGALERGWFWETYRWVKSKARSLMHLGTFAALTLAFMAVLDSKRGWIPVAVLGAASEAMQTLFGFGFGWEDAGDLAVNALGIGIGVLAAGAWIKWRAGRKIRRPLTSPPCPREPPGSS